MRWRKQSSWSRRIWGIWSGICDIASGTFELLKNVILAPVLLLIDLVTGNFSQLASDAANIWNNIRNAASQIWSAMKQTAYSVWNGIKATVVNIASALREAAVSAFQRMADSGAGNGTLPATNCPATKMDLWS